MAYNSPLWAAVPFSESTDFNAVVSTSSETSVLAGGNRQPRIPPDFFSSLADVGRRFRLRVSGVFSNTGTPTLIFAVKCSTTVGTGTFGTAIALSPTITTSSGISNVYWTLEVDIIGKVIGQGSNNCTLTGHGKVFSPAGFASPFYYAMSATTPPSASWTATIDPTLEQFINVSATWGTNSASNTLTAKDVEWESLN